MNEEEEEEIKASQTDNDCEWRSQKLPPGVVYVHNVAPETFLARLEEIRRELPVSRESSIMSCARMFLRDADIAMELRHILDTACVAKGHPGVHHVMSDLRFLDYKAGGYIKAHRDGVRVDEESSAAMDAEGVVRSSDTTFLLFLSDAPEGEGGETVFLHDDDNDDADGRDDDLDDESSTIGWIRPRRNSCLLFEHHLRHRGNCVGLYNKTLLRGDCCREPATRVT